MKIILLFLFCQVSAAVKRSLTVLTTGSSGVSNLPEMSRAIAAEGVRVDYCDSNKNRRSHPGFWEKVNEDDPQILKLLTNVCFETLPLYNLAIDDLKKVNINEAVHIFLCMGGCEWDEKTGDVTSHLQCGYNGEQFLELDLNNATWIANNPMAAIIKPKWNRDKAILKSYQAFYKQTCPDWLKKFMAFAPLKRTDLPSVSLLQRTPSSPVSCHATGFYPNRAELFWRKDGEEIHEDVEHGEILPNNDGTFQLSVHLSVSSISPEDWQRYDCVFQFSDVENNITTRLDKKAIRTNGVSPSEFPSGAVIGAVVGLLLLLALCITGFFIWRRNNHGFRPANTADSSDQTSNPTDGSSKEELLNDVELR
ncbi:major histocompatibility complex class I-related gene protein-like isoform 1-T1 [Odontesthes bonariensis]|uniref:major histocompatibility complex class I-related protein 1-like isoform X1 n=1 Tax=Odontesthes bonariensis TaxID=219752 RepID=UPI003F582374